MVWWLSPGIPLSILFVFLAWPSPDLHFRSVLLSHLSTHPARRLAFVRAVDGTEQHSPALWMRTWEPSYVKPSTVRGVASVGQAL